MSDRIDVDLGAFDTAAGLENVTSSIVFDDGMRAFLSKANDSLTATDHRDVVSSGKGNALLVLYGGCDVVNGGGGRDTIDGGTGDDRIKGGGGNDTLFGGSDNDALFGDKGNDTLYGGNGDDTLVGGGGNDSLDGGNGDDTVSGGKGHDVISGGLGADTLTGGGGADRFVYASEVESQPGAYQRDIITDFAPGVDKIDLESIDADTNTLAVEDAFVLVGDGAFSGIAGELRVETGSGYALLQGDVDGDGVVDFEIEFNGLPALTASDFIL